jgi:phosphoinositide-3-kinase regulatory subunit 4
VEKLAVDPSGFNWLMTGSSRGHLTLWDMRFNLAVNSIQQPQVRKYSMSSLLTCPCFGSSCGSPCSIYKDVACRKSVLMRLQNYPIEALAPAVAPAARLGLQESSLTTPLMYVAAGPQEVGLWDIEQGKCHQVACHTPQLEVTFANSIRVASLSQNPSFTQQWCC